MQTVHCIYFYSDHDTTLFHLRLFMYISNYLLGLVSYVLIFHDLVSHFIRIMSLVLVYVGIRQYYMFCITTYNINLYKILLLTAFF